MPSVARSTASSSCSSFSGELPELQLEHRLHEREQNGAVREAHPLSDLRDDHRERCVRHVDGHHLDLVGNEIGAQVSGVRRLEVHYAGILAQRAPQLSVTDIDRVDLPAPPAEQLCRETTRRCTDIERDTTFEHDWRGERVERGPQLLLALQRALRREHDAGVGPDVGARVRHDHSVDLDLAGRDRAHDVLELGQPRLDELGEWNPTSHVDSDDRERATGIEPAFSAWEADVLPLNYTREARHCRRGL